MITTSGTVAANQRSCFCDRCYNARRDCCMNKLVAATVAPCIRHITQPTFAKVMTLIIDIDVLLLNPQFLLIITSAPLIVL